MGFHIHPVFLITGMTLIGAIVCIALACRASGWIRRAILLIVASALLVPSGFLTIMLKPELVDARFRTYKRLYRDIQIGMTRSEVRDLVERYYPSDGKRMQPKVLADTTNRLSFFMNPEGSREPNCEGIFLEMQEERVVRKQYSPD